jgi:hypothetical protein
MAIPGLFLLFFSVAFYVLVCWLTFVAPAKSKIDPSFLFGIRFLVLKYRLDRWWWCIVPMPRAFLISLVPIIGGDDPRVSLMLLLLIIGSYNLTVVHYAPWKAPILNLIDAGSCALLLIIVIFAKGYLPPVTTIDEGVYSGIMIASVMILYTFCLSGLVLGLLSSWNIGLQGRMGGIMGMAAHMNSQPEVVDPKYLAERFWLSAKAMPKEGTQEELEQGMTVWGVQDLARIGVVLDLLDAYGIRGVAAKQTRTGKVVRQSSSRLNFNTGIGSGCVNEFKKPVGHKAAAEVLKCSCGSDIPEDARFCKRCGKPRSEAAGADADEAGWV